MATLSRIRFLVLATAIFAVATPQSVFATKPADVRPRTTTTPGGRPGDTTRPTDTVRSEQDAAVSRANPNSNAGAAATTSAGQISVPTFTGTNPRGNPPARPQSHEVEQDPTASVPSGTPRTQLRQVAPAADKTPEPPKSDDPDFTAKLDAGVALAKLDVNEVVGRLKDYTLDSKLPADGSALRTELRKLYTDNMESILKSLPVGSPQRKNLESAMVVFMMRLEQSIKSAKPEDVANLKSQAKVQLDNLKKTFEPEMAKLNSADPNEKARAQKAYRLLVAGLAFYSEPFNGRLMLDKISRMWTWATTDPKAKDDPAVLDGLIGSLEAAAKSGFADVAANGVKPDQFAHMLKGMQDWSRFQLAVGTDPTKLSANQQKEIEDTVASLACCYEHEGACKIRRK